VLWIVSQINEFNRKTLRGSDMPFDQFAPTAASYAVLSIRLLARMEARHVPDGHVCNLLFYYLRYVTRRDDVTVIEHRQKSDYES
jgi:hypothetical protein